MSDDQYISFGLAEKYAEEIREARQAESYARHYGPPSELWKDIRRMDELCGPRECDETEEAETDAE